MPYRSIIIDAQKVITKTKLRPGALVADLGTGREGRFALAAARAVGKDGHVFAVDIVKAILPTIESKAAMYGFNNISTVWSDLEILGAAKAISNESLDVAFLATILFQSKHHQSIMREAIRMLKPGGRLAVIDWKNITTAFGPSPSQRVDPEIVKQIAQELNLALVEEFEAGKYYYGLIFKK